MNNAVSAPTLPRTGAALPLGEPICVMGILNVTPDSFSDGGTFYKTDHAVARAVAMAEEGAGVIDIGGESSRPGSRPVPPDEQIRRVEPVIRALRRDHEIPISIDTASAPVARAALDAGADIVNDITALRGDPAMAALVAEHDCPVILMHMQGTPRTMQQAPAYGDVVADVRDFLRERMHAAREAGIRAEQIILDPGFGFGKTTEHNLTILKHLDALVAVGAPLLVGFSRKRAIGEVLDCPVEDRLAGSLAVAIMAMLKGARLLRVHDVRETVHAIRMVDSVARGAG